MSKSSRKKLEYNLKDARKKGNAKNIVDCLIELGDHDRSHDDYDSAIKYYKEAVVTGDEIRYYFDISFACRSLCEIYAEMGNRKLSLEYANDFREIANKSGDVSQIQLSLHVSGWVYEKLWVENSRGKSDLQQALKWCEKSLEYLKGHVFDIDTDKQSINVGGKASMRKAKLERLCASICGNLGEHREAERYWVQAWKFAESSHDIDLKYELLLAKLDFQWADRIRIAQTLVNMAPANKKGCSMLELANIKILCGELEGAKETLLDILFQHKKIVASDRKVMEERLVFVHMYFERLREANNIDVPRTRRRKLYELLGDSLSEYSSESKTLKTEALKLYQKMLDLSRTPQERLPAMISLAETAKELGTYDRAIQYFQDVLNLETSIGKSHRKTIETEVSIFSCRCLENKLTTQDIRLEYEYLLDKIPGDKHNVQGVLNEAYGRYLEENLETGEDLIKKGLQQQKEEEPESEDENDDEVLAGSSSDDDFLLTDADKRRIINSYEKFVQEQNAEEEIRKDVAWSNPHGETRLHLAAKSTDTELLKKLIRYGYNVNALDNSGWTPLAEAVAFKMVDNVKALIDAGADLNIMGRETVEKDDDDGEEYTCGGMTPLMEACLLCQFDIVKLLVRGRAKLGIANQDKWYALDYLKDGFSKMDKDDPRKVAQGKELIALFEKRHRELNLPIRDRPLMIRRRKNNQESMKVRNPFAQKAPDDYGGLIQSLGSKTTPKPTTHRRPIPNDILLYDNRDEDDEEVENFCHDVEDDFCPGSPKFSSTQKPRRSSPTLSDRYDRYSATQKPVRRSTPSAFEQFDRYSSATTQKPRQTPPISTTFNDNDFIEEDMPTVRSRKRKRRSDEATPKRNFISREKRPSTVSLEDLNDDFMDHMSHSTTHSPIPNYQHDFDMNFDQTFPRTPMERYSPHVPSTRGSVQPEFSTTDSCSSSIVSASTKRVSVIVNFIDVNSRMSVRPKKMLNFLSDDEFSVIRQRCREELSAEQHNFQLFLMDDCEVDDYVSLETIQSTPIELNCVISPWLAEDFFRKTNPNDVLLSEKMKLFDSSNCLDLSSVHLLGQEKAICSAVITSRKCIEKIVLDRLKISNFPLEQLCQMIVNSSDISFMASDLSDELLCKIVEKTTSDFSASRIVLSHTELKNGQILSTFLEKCQTVETLEMNNLGIWKNVDNLIASLCNLSHLKALDLSFNEWLTHDLVGMMMIRLSGLTTLSLRNVDLRDFRFEDVCPQLSRLNLAHTQLTDWNGLIKLLINRKTLTSIDLSGTDFSSEHLEQVIKERIDSSPLTIKVFRCPSLESTINTLFPLLTSQPAISPIKLHFSKPVTTVIRKQTSMYFKFLV